MTTIPTMKALPKSYTPAEAEGEILARWEASEAFHAEPPHADDQREPYCILIPPPNVTAPLHLGHAFDNTLQDVLIRTHRMRGCNTLWMPGTDHAGIATQAVVEKRLLAQGTSRRELGREAFVERVQQWKDEYEETITSQLKQMGCSCDWDRQRFTMDPMCARAVREAFFRLFAAGLIYRGKRLVNWDPVTLTALADDEVQMQEIDGHFWYLKYPLLDDAGEDSGDFVTVATTRPETMLGDAAIAVHPRDSARAALVGRKVRLPIVNRVIPIIADEYVAIPDPKSDDPKARFTSGFLKVTPAHDPNDWEIGQRHGLDVINVMAPDASISRDHGWPVEEFDSGQAREVEPFLGMPREEARQAIVQWFKANGLLEKVIDYRHSVGHSYRSHVPIEPYLSDQWYVKVTDDRLVGEAQRALRDEQFEGVKPARESPLPGGEGREGDGELTFFPARYARMYQSWHEGLRDWCISRQLWWGHRIPVWTLRRSDDPQSGTFVPIAEFVTPGEPDDVVRRRALDRRASELRQIIEEFLLAAAVADEVAIRPEDEQWAVVHLCSRSSKADAVLNALSMTWEELNQRRRRSANLTGPIAGPIDCCKREAMVLAGSFASCTQDPDVLDTWFSSGLWPLSTMGWPEPTDFPETEGLLETFNPSNVLCTGRDIITLWVSRMVMFNRYFHGGKVPYRHVYIHPMIQDGHGQRMSKSLGNGVDPRDIIHSHGADALRFTLVQMATSTQDVRLPVNMVCPHCQATVHAEAMTSPAGYRVARPVQACPSCHQQLISGYGEASGAATPSAEMPLARNTSSKFDLGRNFANKLWNAVRFALGNLQAAETESSGGPQDTTDDSLPLLDRWILSRLSSTAQTIEQALTEYQFNLYADALYDFLWRDFCDWYLEAIKPTIRRSGRQQQILRTVLDAILRLLHPICPFVTETLWPHVQVTGPTGLEGVDLPAAEAGSLLACAGWPRISPALEDSAAIETFQRVQTITSAIRNFRSEHRVHPRARITLYASKRVRRLLEEAGEVVPALAGLERVEPCKKRPGDALALAFEGEEVFLGGLTDAVDADAERQRQRKRIADLERAIRGYQSKLENAGYLAKAPPEVVEETRQRLASAEADVAAARKALQSLGDADGPG